MRQSWTDDRLDTLNEKVDRRFDEVDRDFKETRRRFDEVDRRLDRFDERFTGLESDIRGLRAQIVEMDGATQGRLYSVQRSMIYLAVGLMTGMLAGFGGVATLIATQI